ncbi:MAG: glycosyltransferase [Pirellulales bacterium]|nr:glycosyltransferase [Pirellulales bacterium]
MNIALVHDWLTGMRGGEKCLEVLCRRFPDARLYTLLHDRGTTSPDIERMRITTSFLQHVPGIKRHYRYLLPLMPTAIGSFHIPNDVDMVVSFSHAVAKSIQPPEGVPHICYCFTPMRYAWHRRADYFRVTATHKNPMTAARNLVLDWMRDWDQSTADRVTHFIAISRTIARRIEECYGRSSHIIYPPVDTDFYTPVDTPREDFYLYAGALAPYKRVDLAVEAANRLGRRLIVIGSGTERQSLERMAGSTVTFKGWTTDEDIRDHMRRARALLFPANEDFGIVPLEAQACGTPVIALSQGGATETVIGIDAVETANTTGSRGTGFFFNEQTPDSIVGAIRRFEAAPDSFDPLLARRQAERFNLKRFERELVGFVDEVARDSVVSY